MTKEELKEVIEKISPGAEFEENEYLNATVDAKVAKNLLTQLRNDPNTEFDFLFCQSGVDRLEYFLVVYHLESTHHNHQVVIKAKIDREKPEIETVSDIWRTAEFHEREIFDFYGIHFKEHHDLRRIFLEDDWVGFPMRKDYVDEINIVEL